MAEKAETSVSLNNPILNLGHGWATRSLETKLTNQLASDWRS